MIIDSVALAKGRPNDQLNKRAQKDPRTHGKLIYDRRGHADQRWKLKLRLNKQMSFYW